MKKLIYLFLTVLIVACSGDEDCREITGLSRSCSGSSPNDLDCTYSIDIDFNEPILVNETTYYYYKELLDENEIVCWEGEQ